MRARLELALRHTWLGDVLTVFSFRAMWDNASLIQWIRCEPLGEHLILE